MTPHAALLYTTDSDRRSTILSLSLFVIQTINGLEPERVGFVDRSFFSLSLSKRIENPRFFVSFPRHQTRASRQPGQYVLALLRFSTFLSFRVEHGSTNLAVCSQLLTPTTDRGGFFSFNYEG